MHALLPQRAWPLAATLLVVLALSCSGFAPTPRLDRPGIRPIAPRVASGPVHRWIPRGVLSAAPATSRSLSPTDGSSRARLATTAPAPPHTYTQFVALPNDNALKPDANAAAGPNDVVEMINAEWAAYSKSGTNLFQTTLQQWYNFPAWAGMFDPRVIYDSLAGHYVMINIYYAPNGTGYIDLSASMTSSALGNWCKYEINVQDGVNQPDFPGLGFDSQAIYVSMNMYPIGSNTFSYAKLLILNKAQLYQCASPVSSYTFANLLNPDGTLAFAVQPGRTLDNEPAEYLANSALGNQNPGSPIKANYLTMWTLTNPLNNPTLTNAAIPVSTYMVPPNARQKGSSSLIYTGGPMLLQATVYAGALWTALTSAFGTNNQYAAIRWFELDPVNNVVLQGGTYGANGAYAFMPAITVTANGNAIMMFDASTPNIYVGVYYAGRQASAPLNEMSTYVVLQPGSGPFSSPEEYWGDFFSAAVDPADTTKVWICGQYALPGNQWGTVIGEVGY